MGFFSAKLSRRHVGGVTKDHMFHSKQILGEATTRSADKNVQKVLTESGHKNAKRPRKELTVFSDEGPGSHWQVCSPTQH